MSDLVIHKVEVERYWAVVSGEVRHRVSFNLSGSSTFHSAAVAAVSASQLQLMVGRARNQAQDVLFTQGVRR